MQLGFGVSLKIDDDLVAPDAMLAGVATLIQSNHIEVVRSGRVTFFEAAEPEPLLEMAGPLADWWLQHQPQLNGRVKLRFVGQADVIEMDFCRPDLAVDLVYNTIAQQIGPIVDRRTDTDRSRPATPASASSSAT
jgi:hypothetical protein